MPTTIQVSKELKQELDKFKLRPSETYEDILWDFIDDRSELSEQTKKAIEVAREEFDRADTIGHEELKKKYGIE